MKDKLKNFAVSIAFIMLVMAIINFAVDPYNVFRNKKYMDIYSFPDNQYSVLIKAYKDFKCDTLFIGGSNAYTLFILRDFYSYFFNILDYPYFQYKDQYEMLISYIRLHPETKKVYFFISMSPFYNDTEMEMPKIKGDKFNFEEYIFLLCSKTTLSFSIEKIINKFINKKDLVGDFDFEKRMTDFDYYPNNFPSISTDERLVQRLYDDNLFYLKKAVEFLKQKNIDYYFVFEPLHASYISLLFEYPFLQKTVENIKRACVEISDNDVYDFFIVDKYTTCDLSNNNYMYHDSLHSNIIWGMKVFKVLRNESAENDIFVKINKKNIEEHLVGQVKKINDYKIKNQALIDYFKKLNSKEIKEIYKVKMISYENAPEYVLREINTYRKYNTRIEELINQGTPPKRGVFENKF